MADIPDFLPPNLQGLAIGSQIPDVDRKKLGQEQFFELMVAQLQNQDPLKPMESSEFLSQVAQFSAVSGIEDMRSSMADLASSMQSNQALQASMLVGREVLVPGNIASLIPGEAYEGVVDLGVSSPQVTLDVFDAAGQHIRQIELGAHAAGPVRFSWDGLNDAGQAAPAGIYSVRANAVIDGQNEAVGTLIRSRVDSVTLGAHPAGLTLNLKDLGPVSFNDIRELL